VFVAVVTVVAIAAVVDYNETIGSVRYLKDAMDDIVTSLLQFTVENQKYESSSMVDHSASVIVITAKKSEPCPVP
jgi:hypothetical protein